MLPEDNTRTQGAVRRAWYRKRNPEHLRAVAELVNQAIAAHAATPLGDAIILGAGASDHLLLVDVDVAGMTCARDAFPESLRRRVDLLQADVTGGVSEALADDLLAQPWRDLRQLGGDYRMAPVATAAACIERCPTPTPPSLDGVAPRAYELVISSLVLTQLYSLPLLDVADMLGVYAPKVADLRETYAPYRVAAQTFRRRVAQAHLALLTTLLAPGGVALLLTDRIAHLLPPSGGPHARDPRETLAVLPSDTLAIPVDLATRFTLVGAPRTWNWLVSAPDATHPGRLYEAVGVVLRSERSPT